MFQDDFFGMQLRLKKLNGFSAIAAAAFNIEGSILEVDDNGSISVMMEDGGFDYYYPQSTGLLFTFVIVDVYYDIDDYGTSTYKIMLPPFDGEDHYIAIDTFNAGSEGDNPEAGADEEGTASMSI